MACIRGDAGHPVALEFDWADINNPTPSEVIVSQHRVREWAKFIHEEKRNPEDWFVNTTVYKQFLERLRNRECKPKVTTAIVERNKKLGLCRRTRVENSLYQPPCRHCGALLYSWESKTKCCGGVRINRAEMARVKEILCKGSFGIFKKKEVRQDIRNYNALFQLAYQNSSALGPRVSNTRRKGLSRAGFQPLNKDFGTLHLFGKVFLHATERPDQGINVFFLEDKRDAHAAYKTLDPKVVASIVSSLKYNNKYVAKYIKNTDFLEQKRRYLNCNAATLKQAAEENRVDTLTIVTTDGKDQLQVTTPDRIHIKHTTHYYDELCYPLIYQHGEGGWDAEMKTVHMRYVRYLLLSCATSVFDYLGPLKSEFVLSSVSRMYQSRIGYQRRLQAVNRKPGEIVLDSKRSDVLRQRKRQRQQEEEISKQEEMYMPHTFAGSRAYHSRFVTDMLYMSMKRGNATWMITIVFNVNCPEMMEVLRRKGIPGATPYEFPEDMERIFRHQVSKITELMKKEDHVWGKYKWSAQHIEYQRSGNPHVHIVWATDFEGTPEAIDRVIQSYWPHPDHPAFPFMKLMIHHHSARCSIKNGKPCACLYNFPRPACPETTIDPYGRVTYKRFTGNEGPCLAFRGTKFYKFGKRLTDAWANSTNHDYLARAQMPFQVEHIGQSLVPGYPLKYLGKPEKNLVKIRNPTKTRPQEKGLDAGEKFLRGREMSACQAMAYVFGLSTITRYPAVIVLPCHSSPRDPTQITKGQGKKKGEGLDQLERYFCRDHRLASVKYEDYFYNYILTDLPPSRSKKTSYATLKTEFPDLFIEELERSERKLNCRVIMKQRKMAVKRDTPTECRIRIVRPDDTDNFYFRILLNHMAGFSYDDYKTYNNHKHDTYFDACVARGLVDSANSYDIAMQQAVDLRMTSGQLISLFVSLAVIGAPNVRKIYDKYEEKMALGYVIHFVRQGCTSQLAKYKARTKLLCEIHERFDDNSLDTDCLPQPNPIECKEYGFRFNESEYEKFSVLNDEKAYWTKMYEKNFAKMYPSQAYVVNTIYETVMNHDGKTASMHFVQGRAGTGKSYTMSTLVSKCKSAGKVVVVCALTGIAASVYHYKTRPMTLHGFAKIKVQNDLFSKDYPPGPMDREYTSTINPYGNSQRVDLIREMDLLVIDEISMADKDLIDTVDILHRKARKKPDVPFGGCTVVFVGDHLQLPPVVKSATTVDDVIDRMIHRWELWDDIKKYALTKSARQKDDPEFYKTLQDVANGELKDNILRRVRVTNRPTVAFRYLYPDIEDTNEYNEKNKTLCNRNITRTRHNNMFRAALDTEKVLLLSSDTILDGAKRDDDLEPYEMNKPLADKIKDLLKDIRRAQAGVPPRALELKVGMPVMLMRNLDVSRHLVNGKRGIVKKVSNDSRFVLVDFGIEPDFTPIPRINFMIQPHGVPYATRRLQFPLTPSAALTVHKAQAQTLDRIVLDTRDGFNDKCPGQLYVGLSRVRRKQDLIILTTKRNIVKTYPDGTADVKVPNYVCEELVNMVKSIEKDTKDRL